MNNFKTKRVLEPFFSYSDGCWSGLFAAFLLFLIVGTAVFAWLMYLPPNPLPLNAPKPEFSAYRAINYIKAMAIEPHPGGSKANEKGYEYITEQLRMLGVEFVVERPIMRMDERTVERNGAILAIVRGSHSTGALAVDAHFDSTPYGPGAADDLSGCAAMLETIRALKNSPPLTNDIIFCFSDKEEMSGPGGPGVFVRHPWFKKVKLVVGLETRGNSGPALMFETGSDNGFVIRQLAKSDAMPRANSIMTECYMRSPFDTDFTEYKKQGLPGLNVAYIDGFGYYHSRNDASENVSLASLQHHGQYALGLCRQLGNETLKNCKAPNVTYFNILGSKMIIYPQNWGLPYTIIVLSIFGCVLFFGFFQKQLTIKEIITGLAVFPCTSLISFIPMALLAWYVMFGIFHEHALYFNGVFCFAVMMMGIAALFFSAMVVRRIRSQNLMAGTLLWWAVGLMFLQYSLPNSAYILLWPLLFASLGLFILIRSSYKIDYFFITLCSLPMVLMVTPSLIMLCSAFTALAAPGVMVILLLFLSVFLPQMTLFPVKHQIQLGGFCLVTGIVLFIGACISNTPTASHPRQNCLAYTVNFDTQKAYWVSSDATLDPWMYQYIPKSAPWVSLDAFLGDDDGYTYRQAAAPLPPFEKLILRVIADRVINHRRFLKLFIDSPRDAQRIQLLLESDSLIYRANVIGIELPGNFKKNSKKEQIYDIKLETMPNEGGIIELEVEAEKPLRFLVREISFSLPEFPDFVPRPPYLMALSNCLLDRSRALNSDHSYSICRYIF